MWRNIVSAPSVLLLPSPFSAAMSRQDQFDRIVSALHEAALDDTLWPSASALIDEGVGMVGSHFLVLSGQARADLEVLYQSASYYPLEDDQEYTQHYFSHDERIPRFLRLPDSLVVHVPTLYTAQEWKTSPTPNELLRRSQGRNGLNVRLDGPEGCHIAWALADSTDPNGWRSEQIAFITQLLPHIRQFVRVRQALASAEALHTSLTYLLDNALIGVLSLDRHGTIVETNVRGLRILRRGDGVIDRDGILRARFPTDNATLQRLLARALPRWGQPVSGGSMTVQRAPGTLPLTLHISPVAHRADFGAQRIAALVLLVDPTERPQVDPACLAMTLGLTRAESHVAAALAAGHSVRDIAVATHRTQATVRSHVKQLHRKLGVHTQADVVRLVLTTAGAPLPRA